MRPRALNSSTQPNGPSPLQRAKNKKKMGAPHPRAQPRRPRRRLGGGRDKAGQGGRLGLGAWRVVAGAGQPRSGGAALRPAQAAEGGERIGLLPIPSAGGEGWSSGGGGSCWRGGGEA